MRESDQIPGFRARAASLVAPRGSFVATMLKVPIHLYRWTLKPFLGRHCRHLPTCSDYGLEAIDRNGAWRGFWLTLSRLSRCHFWGTAGFDPVPDIRSEHHPFAPWRYGRWTGRHMQPEWRWDRTF
jgi:putative membrane protein insertion efficiency factor